MYSLMVLCFPFMMFLQYKYISWETVDFLPTLLWVNVTIVVIYFVILYCNTIIMIHYIVLVV
jgi:hypothetical protein